MRLTFPQEFKIVQGGFATTNGGLTSTRITLRDAHKAWIVVTLKNAVGFAEVCTPNKSKTVAGGSETTIPATTRIWANEDCVTSDTLVEKTAAANYTTDNVAKIKQVVFEIDPADLGEGFDCVNVGLSDSSQATDFAEIHFILQARYKQGTPPSALTD